MKNNRSVYLCRAAMTAVLYVILTYVSAEFGLASGAVQVRLSEALCVLPVFMPAAVPGLAVGCFCQLDDRMRNFRCNFRYIGYFIRGDGNLCAAEPTGLIFTAADFIQYDYYTLCSALCVSPGRCSLVSGCHNRSRRIYFGRNFRILPLQSTKSA